MLAVVNRAIARALSAPAADIPAAMADASEMVSSSQSASAAMESLSALGMPEPQAFGSISLGLRLAVPILSRLAHANAAPRVVEEVLALWVQEAELAARLDERAAAVLGPNTRGVPPAAGAGAGAASSMSSERLALERGVFDADTRAGVRGAPFEARLVLFAAMAAMLEHVRARPYGRLTEDQVKAMLAHMPCDICDIAQVAAAASTRAYEAFAAEAAAATNVAGGVATNRQFAQAVQAACHASEAAEEAAAALEAAMAARGGGAMGPSAEGAAGAAAAGAGSAPDGGADLGQAPGQAAGAASGSDDSEESEEMPDDISEELWLNEMELDLAEQDAGMGTNFTKGRNTCACAPGSTSAALGVPA